MIETVEFFGEVLLVVLSFSIVSAIYRRLCQVVEGLSEVRYYLHSIMRIVDKYAREDEARRKVAEPVVIDLKVGR